MNRLIVKLEKIQKTYRTGEVEVRALRGVDLVIERGEFTAFAGPSGSGKTTLLHIIGGLDLPTSGAVEVKGRPLASLSETQRSDLRRDHIGFVFQAYNLVPVLTVAENVEYVMVLQGVSFAERRRRVAEVLKEVGLSGMEDRRPAELSGGQQQRVAVARAIVTKPELILADEPTANLDSATGEALLQTMGELNESRGVTFLFSTHDQMIMDYARRLVLLKDGQISSDVRRDAS